MRSIEDQTILVTGGAGVIGQELVKILVNAKVKVICIDRKSKPHSMPEIVTYYQCDLANIPLEVISGYNPDILFHLAATFERTQETHNFWNDNFMNNILLSHRVLEAAKQSPNLKKFIFASSYLVYSPDQYLSLEPRTESIVLNESSLINPRNLIGSAKYYIEKELEYLNRLSNNFCIISARIFRVYGKGSKDFISRQIRAALDDKEQQVYNRENRFDFIYAGDVAEGLISLAKQADASGIFNLGSGSSHMIGEIQTLLKLNFPDIKIIELGSIGEFEASCAGIKEISSLTGWRPNTPIEEGIRIIIEYERNNGTLYA